MNILKKFQIHKTAYMNILKNFQIHKTAYMNNLNKRYPIKGFW